jgi:hypothetical protein
MNILDPILPAQREAKIRYGDGEYQVIRTGEFVRCGVTGDPIRMENLKYWNVNEQIAYKSADIAFADYVRRGYGR